MTPPESRIPRPPEKPDPQECCNRGCCPCIFDYYWDALDRWRATVERMGLDPDAVLVARGQTAAEAEREGGAGGT